MRNENTNTVNELPEVFHDFYDNFHKTRKERRERNLKFKVVKREVPTVEVTPKDWREFKELLKGHDFNFQYSDDHKFWTKEKAKHDRINSLFAKLKKENEKRASKMMRKYKK